ncbi:MAG: HPr family phosphocarrier protein [Candidatus Omnitrophica bacterium CG_4_9_14_0_2_um_filter_42_8]|nr:MAG: PTS sugar transporter subunit IIA [Candidatus Omnitrophica bacterium CG22_combo_CG10-13_8_21_14_all_43_16]PJC48689.1 MAG: HPr family phosphocarrier protein [Candidatus Omnitrophica bacterium CG_4_9_14_0_2_um_filter_42_8]
MLIEKKLTIQNELGLHARPAALFVQIANKYESDIVVKKGRQEVNGKSIMGLLTLAAEKGAMLHIKVNGPDAKEAVQELEKVILGDIP